MGRHLLKGLALAGTTVAIREKTTTKGTQVLKRFI
jgi:hypothetical protein